MNSLSIHSEWPFARTYFGQNPTVTTHCHFKHQGFVGLVQVGRIPAKPLGPHPYILTFNTPTSPVALTSASSNPQEDEDQWFFFYCIKAEQQLLCQGFMICCILEPSRAMCGSHETLGHSCWVSMTLSRGKEALELSSSCLGQFFHPTFARLSMLAGEDAWVGKQYFSDALKWLWNGFWVHIAYSCLAKAGFEVHFMTWVQLSHPLLEDTPNLITLMGEWLVNLINDTWMGTLVLIWLWSQVSFSSYTRVTFLSQWNSRPNLQSDAGLPTGNITSHWLKRPPCGRGCVHPVENSGITLVGKFQAQSTWL